MRNPMLSLRTRLILIIALGFSVFTLAMLVQVVHERNTHLELATSELSVTARVAAIGARNNIKTAEVLFGNLIPSSDLRRFVDAEECQYSFAQVVSQLPEFTNAMLALPDGTVICVAVPLKHVMNIADWPDFKAALASNDVIVGEARKSRVTGERVLPIYKAVRDATGEVRGVIHIGLALSWLNNALDDSTHLKGARVGLIDPQGRVLARYPDPETWVGRSAFDTPFFKAVRASGGAGVAHSIGFDGVPRAFGLAHFYPTQTGPITLWVGYAVDSVTAEADSHFRSVLIGASVLLLLSFATIWSGIERLILRPVSILSNIARRLGSGELSARSGIGVVRSEMGALVRSFDEMAEALESKNREVILAERVLKVLSAWNQVLLKSGDEHALAEGMCKAIVEAGQYQMAWVGFAEDDPAKTVRPVAFAGGAEDYFKTLGVTWADTEQGQGPVGRAIRVGTPIVVHDSQMDSGTERWREHIRRFGYASIIALSLRKDGGSFGALVVGAAEADAFAEHETVLLGEAARDLAFAILEQRSRAESERLKASLQEVDARFAAAAEASPDAQFVFKCVRDSAGSIVDFEITALNARAAQQIGVARDAAIGKTYLGLLPLYKALSLFDEYLRVATTGTRFESEFPYEVPEKGIRWFRQQAVRVGDGIAISLRDITGWKKTGERLRNSEERLRHAMEAAHMGAWQWDLASDQLSASGGMGALFGVAPESGPRNPKEFLDAVHPADREALSRAMAQDRTDSVPKQLEYRVIWPDGSVHWLAVSSTVIADTSGKPTKVAGLLTDITARKEAEIARDRANRALKTLSAGNEELVRASSELGLLNAVCGVIVAKGGYGMAAVGYPNDDPGKTIAPMAWAGVEDEYITGVKHIWADTAEGQRPVGRAIRTRKPVIARNISGDLAFEPIMDLVAKHGFASNIALPLLVGTKLIGALSIYSKEQDAFDEAEMRLLEELAGNLSYGIATLRIRDERDRIAREHEHHAEILRRGLEESIQAIAATVEMRDPYTSGHQKRVAEVAVAIAKALGLDEDRVQGIHLAGVVHDLGKIRIPAEILSKPSKLSAIEHELIKGHPQAGYDILKDISFPWPIARIVLEHHERMDGSGYPQGIKGDEMLLESRIMAVADVVEAMASHRPYRASLGIEAALKEVERGRGTTYDAAAVDALLKLIREDGYELPN